TSVTAISARLLVEEAAPKALLWVPTLENTFVTSGLESSICSTCLTAWLVWYKGVSEACSNWMENSPLSPFSEKAVPINPAGIKAKAPIRRTNTPPTIHLLCTNAQRSICPYVSFKLSKNFSKWRFILPHKESFLNTSNLPQREANNGVSVKDTNKLIRVENTTTKENSRNIFPIKPPANARGTNTTTSTRVIAIAVKPISFLPSTAAASLSLPISIWR